MSVNPLMSTATMAWGPVPSSRVMHWGTPVGQLDPVERAYLTSSAPGSAPAPDVIAFPRPAMRPLSFRSARIRRVVLLRSATGIAKTHPHPLVGLDTPPGQVALLASL